jgi:hypothetical protein
MCNVGEGSAWYENSEAPTYSKVDRGFAIRSELADTTRKGVPNIPLRAASRSYSASSSSGGNILSTKVLIK